MTQRKPYEGASFEAIDDIRKATAEDERGGLTNARFKAVFNEIDRLLAEDERKRRILHAHGLDLPSMDEQKRAAGEGNVELGV